MMPIDRPMRALLALGQSVWLDYTQRRLTRCGGLATMVADGLRGMTTNPGIFEQAVTGTQDYDEELRDLFAAGMTTRDAFDALMVHDVQEAADVFRPVYEDTDGRDGFVSIEVGPEFARDTHGSVEEARRLWRMVSRPNVMIKLPGTREGLPAIKRCLIDGINVNVTLLFSLAQYEAVAETYLCALEERIGAGERVDGVASAASLFVSRVDAAIDPQLDMRHGALAGLRGKVAVANARLVYASFRSIAASTRWRALAVHGARLQRPLWASTATKDASYSDVRYIESLIGAETVTTVPPATLRAFGDHGIAVRTLPGDIMSAVRTMNWLDWSGISMFELGEALQNKGLAQFSESVERALHALEEKRAQSLAAPVRVAACAPDREPSSDAGA